MKVIQYIKDMFNSESVRTKLFWTLGLLAFYRVLVYVPHPFLRAEFLQQIVDGTGQMSGGLEYFAMLMGGTLKKVSIIAVGLIPFINASIIMQLLSAVIPKLEELKEQGETGQQKIKQYTRWLAFPLALVQSFGIIFFINSLFKTQAINVGNPITLIMSAFVLATGTILLMRIGELITEKGITNGISLIIFSSIVSGMVPKFHSAISGSNNWGAVLGFIVVVLLVLVVLATLLTKTTKEIPVVYSRQGDVQETATLPIPLNPVGMIPIIFSIAFVSFPYLVSQVISKVGVQNQFVMKASNWIQANFNIYTQTPSLIVIGAYFCLVVMFTFFYALIMFNPEKIADNIQKRGGFIPGIRPGEETAQYINTVLMHLCLWGGMGLAFIGVYSYLINYLGFMQTWIRELGSIPVVVSGAGIVIIVGVVQELLNKIDSELLMEKYDEV